MSARRHYLYWLPVVVAIAASAGGCAKQKARTAMPQPMTESAQAAQAALADRLAAVRTVRARGRLIVMDGDRTMTDIVVAIALPDRARFDASDSLADVLTAAGISGSRVWVWLPAEHALYRSRSSRANLRKALGVDWDAGDLVHALAGTVHIDRDAVLVPDATDASLFAVRGKTIAVKMDMKRRLPVALRRTADARGGGALRYEVRFEAYRTVGGTAFPHRIVAETPSGERCAIIEYEKVELNTPIDDGVFRPPHKRS